MGPTFAAKSSPHVAIPDGIWNHGEGFAPSGTPDADYGGWHGNDDGQNVTGADIHQWANSPANWNAYTWADPVLTPASPITVRRFVGYLRPPAPNAPSLPTSHPLYGSVGPYVDQGAFELFVPMAAPTSNQKILLCIQVWETRQFPKDNADNILEWYQIYPGFFSPDGLERREPLGAPRVPGTFQNNTNPDAVVRPPLTLLRAWTSTDPYWLMLGSLTLSVTHRQTTLNEQRYLQIVQAAKELLMENSPRNPLGAGNQLTPEQIQQSVVVCFVGGSNGGFQAQLATLRHPQLVHGCYSEVMNPSLQRFYGEHAMGHALSRLSGAAFLGAGITARDHLHWDQYFWSQGIEAHDASFLRLFLAGNAYRPGCFAVGDEDITTTGTDFAAVASGAGWAASGAVTGTTAFGPANGMRLGWMVAPNASHQSVMAPVTNPYTGVGNIYQSDEIAREVFEDAVRVQGVIGPMLPAGTPVATAHTPRLSNQELRGLDDPYEWFLGRAGEALPTVDAVNDPLVRDDAFFAAANPGSAGSNPGRREPMRIHGNALYVGSADGFVSKFVVDQTPGMKQRLQRVAQSRRLGHEVSGLCIVGNDLVVATRRHLHKLPLNNLQAVPVSVQLPWEIAEPHRLTLADVLPIHAGPELVFASVHGGLVFYSPGLAPVHEWPEPGILDFRVQGGTVTILSNRGVLANVTFHGPQHTAQLEALSESIPPHLRQNGAIPSLPAQGTGMDLELMHLNWNAFGVGVPVAAVSLWSGDVDGLAVRSHWLSTLDPVYVLPNLDAIPTGNMVGGIDIATCTEAAVDALVGVGDHLLVLSSNELRLYDQVGTLIGKKSLITSQQGYYPFGLGAHTLCVGELASNPGGYPEEVVVATTTGLMWLHVNDVLGTTVTALPATAPSGTTPASGYWLDFAGAPGAVNTHVQPRTNESLSCAWAMARRPNGTGGFDSDLHVLDQHGAYWKVDYGGSVRLQMAPGAAWSGAQNWAYAGSVLGASPQLAGYLKLIVSGGSVHTGCWVPVVGPETISELGPPGTPYIPFNWSERWQSQWFLDGFAVGTAGASVVGTGSGLEVWHWTGYSGWTAPNGKVFHPWGNMLEGLRLDASGAGYQASGLWASSTVPQAITGGFGDICDYLPLRSWFNGVQVMNQQSVQAVRYVNGTSSATAVVLGCAGGRVKILHPGSWRVDPQSGHTLSTVEQAPVDLGFGLSAMATRYEPPGTSSQKVIIWAGTVSHPTPRPTAYGSAVGVLQDGEVAAGSVARMEWVPGNGFQNVTASPVLMCPTSGDPRGAFGVVGLREANLSAWPGRELLVATMSGDLVILDADSLAERWRTHVAGGIGFYNSIQVENLNPSQDNLEEIYIAGTKGIWRFRQHGEAGVP